MMPAVDSASPLADRPELGLLMVAVPMWIDRLRDSTFEQRREIGLRCGQHVAEKGDNLLFRTKGKSADAFNAMAEGLACLAYQPGGVTFAGLHFCTAACCTCHDTGMDWTDPHTCTCAPGPDGQHERYCGAEPCPHGCKFNPAGTAAPEPERKPKRRPVENVELP